MSHAQLGPKLLNFKSTAGLFNVINIQIVAYPKKLLNEVGIDLRKKHPEHSRNPDINKLVKTSFLKI